MSSFRRSTILRAVALWLVVLGISPLTAPFSTFSFVDSSQSSATEALKTVDHTKPGFHTLLILTSVLAGSVDSRGVGILIRTARAGLRAAPFQHAILRV